MECPSCHSRNPPGFRYCGYCRAELAGEGLVLETGGDLQAELRHLTVMFCDLAGSTPRSAAMEPEAYAELLKRYHDAAGAVVQRLGGFIGQYHGDGLLAYFCYPKAREDAAVLGVRSALGILRAIGELNVVLAREGHEPLAVRLGLHTGRVVVGEIGSGQGHDDSVAMGKVPNVAARLQGEASLGTAVLSGDTWRLVRGAIRCRPLGPKTLKGVAEPVPVYEVIEEIDERAPVGRGAAFVGRAPELARLVHAWRRTAGGAGEKLLVRGEPGIGKSRLVEEFRRTLDGEPVYWLALSGAAGAQSSALHPVLALLHARLGFSREDGPAERFEKIERFAEQFAFPREETAALLATLLGLPESTGLRFTPLSPAAARQGAIIYLRQFLAAHAVQRPVVLAVEDLHWLDPSTLEALRLLVETGLPPRVLLLATARPEFDGAWLGAADVTLDRFGAAEAMGFIESVAGERELTPELMRQLVRKADGVPLFIEEMTRMVLDAELDRMARGDTSVPPLAIPDTLHALLMARLDRTTNHREVAQLAAVIGGEFPYEMLRALCPLAEPVLREELARLTAAGLLAQRGTLPDATFQFCHALIQDEAYQSLLRRKRQAYHEQIAQLFEQRFSETRAQQPELVAHHYTEAGRAAEAVEYWARAAQQGSERGASHEALSQTERGLQLLPALGDSPRRVHFDIALTLLRAWALTLLRGYAAPEVAADYRHALGLYRQLGEARAALDVAPSLFGFYIATSNFAVAAELADDMVRSRDTTLRAQGWFSRGTYRYYIGELAGALAAFEKAVAIFDSESVGKLRLALTLDPGTGSLGWGSLTLVMLGRMDEALAWAHAAVERAEKVRHPHSIAIARHFRQLMHHWRGEPAQVLVGMEENLAYCREQGFGFWEVANGMLLAWARSELEPSAPLYEALQRGIAFWQRSGSHVGGPQHYASLAQVALRLGHFDAAFAALEKGREYVVHFGERVYEPQLGILEGVAWRDRAAPDHARAEACFRAAIAQAQASGARWHELRASLELARLLQQLGRSAEARAALRPIADTFPKKSKLPALLAARALLAVLPKTARSRKRSASANGRTRAAAPGTRRTGRQSQM